MADINVGHGGRLDIGPQGRNLHHMSAEHPTLWSLLWVFASEEIPDDV